jgi:hypothetical protein
LRRDRSLVALASLLMACSSTPQGADGGHKPSDGAVLDHRVDDGPAADVGAAETGTDAPATIDAKMIDAPEETVDAIDAPGEAGPDGANACVPEPRDAAACVPPVQERTWVVTTIPSDAYPPNYAQDMLGNVTRAGVFTRRTSGELSLWANGASKVVTAASPFAGEIRATSEKDIWIVPVMPVGTPVAPFSMFQFAHWDGTAWTVVNAPPLTDAALTAFGVSGSDLWLSAAVGPLGSVRQPVMYQWKAGTWSTVPSPLDAAPGARIAAIWSTSPTDVWAGGQRTTATDAGAATTTTFLMRWDGSTWSLVTPPVLGRDGQSILSIWGTANDVWFGGTDAGLNPVGNIWHFDGTTWSDEALPTSQKLNNSASGFFELWGTGPTDVWAAAAGPNVSRLVVHYDGQSWSENAAHAAVRSRVFPDEAVAVHIEQVKGTTPDDLWGVATVPAEICGGSQAVLGTLLHLQPNTCGDGTLGACEECDPPSRPKSGHQCGCDCHLLRCGNGRVDPGEDCDPPSAGDHGVFCDATCHVPTCGNNKIDPGEDCDPPNGATCDPSCRNIPTACGDGRVQTGEECDAPNGRVCQACKLTCCGACLGATLLSTGPGGSCTLREACSRLSGQDRNDCYALLDCLLPQLLSCTISSGAPTCYGTCKAAYRTVAKSTDDAEVLRQLGDPATTVSAVTSEVFSLEGFGCKAACISGIDLPPSSPSCPR